MELQQPGFFCTENMRECLIPPPPDFAPARNFPEFRRDVSNTSPTILTKSELLRWAPAVGGRARRRRARESARCERECGQKLVDGWLLAAQRINDNKKRS